MIYFVWRNFMENNNLVKVEDDNGNELNLLILEEFQYKKKKYAILTEIDNCGCDEDCGCKKGEECTCGDDCNCKEDHECKYPQERESFTYVRNESRDKAYEQKQRKSIYLTRNVSCYKPPYDECHKIPADVCRSKNVYVT